MQRLLPTIILVRKICEKIAYRYFALLSRADAVRWQPADEWKIADRVHGIGFHLKALYVEGPPNGKKWFWRSFPFLFIHNKTDSGAAESVPLQYL